MGTKKKFHLKKQKDLKDEIKQEALNILFTLTGITEEQFEFFNTNIKKFQVKF